MKPKVTWILIADGAHARVFEHRGAGTGLVPLPDLAFDQEQLQTREVMADKQGRSFSSGSPGMRSAIEKSTDAVVVRERRFVQAVAETLDKKFQEGAFERLIIAAAPTALGNIRPALTDRLRAIIMAELPKDLINTPRQHLDAHFATLLPL